MNTMTRLEEARDSLRRVETAIDAIIDICDIVSEEHSRRLAALLNEKAADLAELVDDLERA